MRQYPDEPRIDGAEKAAVVLDGIKDIGDVVHQPAQFQRAKVRADRQTTALLQKVLATALHFQQQCFHCALRAGVKPH